MKLQINIFLSILLLFIYKCLYVRYHTVILEEGFITFKGPEQTLKFKTLDSGTYLRLKTSTNPIKFHNEWNTTRDIDANKKHLTYYFNKVYEVEASPILILRSEYVDNWGWQMKIYNEKNQKLSLIL